MTASPVLKLSGVAKVMVLWTGSTVPAVAGANVFGSCLEAEALCAAALAQDIDDGMSHRIEQLDRGWVNKNDLVLLGLHQARHRRQAMGRVVRAADVGDGLAVGEAMWLGERDCVRVRVHA